ncbi:MAG: EpsG family protein [Bacteroidales bacterium]
MFYLIVFAILLSFALLESCDALTKRNHQILIICAYLILVGIAGLRFETGLDWDTYTAIFEQTNPIFHAIKTGNWGVQNLEIGYVLFCSIVKELGGTIQTVFFIVTLFNISLLLCALKKYTKQILFALFIYYGICYFMLEMIVIRQAIAVAITFWGLQYIEKKQFWRFLLITLLAFCFHRMAIIMLPLYFFLRRRIATSIWIFIIGLGATLMLFKAVWFSTAYLEISKMLGTTFYQKALYYVEAEFFAIPRTISIGFFLNIFLFIGLLWKRKEIEKLKYGTIFLNLFYISLVAYYYGYELIEISNRFRLFFLISLIVLFPTWLNSFQLYTNKLIVGTIIIFYSFLYSRPIFLETPSTAAYNPYQNYLIYEWGKKISTGAERLKQSNECTINERKELKRNSMNNLRKK